MSDKNSSPEIPEDRRQRASASKGSVVVQVQGDGNRIVLNKGSSQPHQSQLWERVAAVLAGMAVVALICFLAIRNQRLDPQIALYVRLILSLAVAVLGGTVPGFLHLQLKRRGNSLRAGGALALFVLTYVYTPNMGLGAGEVESTVSHVSSGVDAIQSKMACADATAANLILAVRSRNARRTLALVDCSRDLLADLDFRRELVDDFSKATFADARPYLEELQRGGIDYLRDFAPVTRNGTLVYVSTPLWTAVLKDGDEAFDWLVRTSKAGSLASYPKGYLTKILADLSMMWMSKDRMKPLTVKAVRFLVHSGVRRDDNDYEPYRIARLTAFNMRYPTGYGYGPGGRLEWSVRRSKNGTAMIALQLAPLWEDLAEVLAPAEAARKAILERNILETNLPPRIRTLDAEITDLADMMKYGGLRRVNGNAVKIPPEQLRDGDFLRDDALRPVSGRGGYDAYTTVGAVRQLLAETKADRARFQALLSQ
jgi:hypothetical protein